MEYELEKYKNRNQKHECPSCGNKTFVRYIGEDGNYLHPSIGKCDKADSCGYHRTPKDYFTENPTRENWKSEKHNKKKEATKPVDYLPIDEYLFPFTGKGNGLGNNLAKFLYKKFPDKKQRINEVLWNYLCGDYGDAILFPYLDVSGRFCTGKIMKYDPATGKRIKDEAYCIDWVHSKLMRKGIIPDSFNHRLCLFGEQQIQLASMEGKPVAVVESEKTAIIASLFIDEFMWVSSGALGWLNVEKLKPFRNRRIVLFPDTSKDGTAFERWSRIADEAAGKGFKINVDRTLEEQCTAEEKAAGFDIADFITK